MKFCILLTVVLFAAIEYAKSECEVAPSPKCRVGRAAATNRRFSYRLYREIRNTEPKDKNIFLSPLNIGMAVTMLLTGATGKTREGIIEGLKWQHTIDKFEHIDLPCLYEFYNRATTIDTASNLTLKTANKVYANEGLPFSNDSQNSLKKYGAPLEEVNFTGEPEKSRKTINSWVSQQTEGLIPELFNQGDITWQTVIALTSAIYFKGTWVEEFTLMDKPVPFIVSAEKIVSATFMERRGTFRYLEREDHLFFDLPYKANINGNCLDVSMILISRQNNPFKSSRAVLNDIKMPRLIEDLRNENTWRAILRIPKFKINTEYDMKEHLQSLGMGQMFSPNSAELMNFIEEDHRDTMPNLFVSKVVHKAFVEVNEEGTEAAAATGILVAARSFFIPPVFTFNKPFTFLIYDHSRNSILFMGRIVDPTAS